MIEGDGPEETKKKVRKVTLPRRAIKTKKVPLSKLKEQQEQALEFIENYKGTEYTREQIKEWKILGIPKPDFVKELDWKTESLSNLQQTICYMSACVLDANQIATMTGSSPKYISNVINSKAGKDEIRNIQEKLWGDKFTQIINKIVPLAVQTALTVMMDPKTKAQTKVDAAFRFMDRAMGKPVQQIDVKDNLIRSVYEKLDQQRAIEVGAIAATVISDETSEEEQVIVEEKKKDIDPIDSWVEENL